MMRKLALALLVIALAGCGKAAPQAEAPAPESGKAVSLRVGTLPDGWEEVSGSVLEYQYRKGTASFMIKTEAFAEKEPLAIAEAAEDIFRKSFGEYARVSLQETKIAGYPAGELIFTCVVSGLAMEYQYVYLPLGSEVYAITIADLEEGFADLAGDRQAILAGISAAGG